MAKTDVDKRCFPFDSPGPLSRGSVPYSNWGKNTKIGQFGCIAVIE